MGKNKFLSIILFFVLLISSLSAVFGADEFGNELYDIDVYQNSFDFAEINSNPSGANYTVNNYLWKNFRFEILTKINTTDFSGFVYNYQGVGLQIFDENDTSIWASGLTPYPLGFLYEPLPIEFVEWNTNNIVLNCYKTRFQLNVTLWYYNSTIPEWQLSEEWEFNLNGANYFDSEEEEDIRGFDLFLAIFVLCLFVFPLSIVALIKLKNPKWIKVSIFSFIGLVSLFYMIMRISPFG